MTVCGDKSALPTILRTVRFAHFYLCDCAGGGQHGSFIVESQKLPSFVANCVVPVNADVDDWLLAAEKCGILVRGKQTPTVSQRAFMGLQFKSKIPDSYASTYYWSLVFGDSKHIVHYLAFQSVMYDAAAAHIARMWPFCQNKQHEHKQATILGSDLRCNDSRGMSSKRCQT